MTKVVSILFALVLAALMLPSAAHAEPARTVGLKREYASAEFRIQEGCSRTFIQVGGVSGTFFEKGEPADKYGFGSVLIRRFGCSGALEVDILYSNSTPYDNFNIKGQLASATQRSTVIATDAVSGSEIPVTIDLTWQGTGEITDQRRMQHGDIGECSYNGFTDVASRDADAFGTITFGDTVLSLSAPTVAYLGTEHLHLSDKGCEDQ